MTNTSIIFERLKKARKDLGLNQAAAADLCGVKRETWSRYESGLISPGMDVLAALATAGADVQYILTGIQSGVHVTQYQLNNEEAEQLILSMRERALLDNYRHIDDEDGKRYVEQSAQLAAKAIKDETQSRTQKKAG